MIIIGYNQSYEFWILGYQYGDTKRQENNDKEASSSQRENSMEHLAYLVQNIIEQGMRRDNQPIAPLLAPPPRQDTSKSTGERLRKLQPSIFDGEVDLIQAEQWIRTTERMLVYAKVPNGDKVPCATFMLRHHVEYWWDTISTIHDVTVMT